MKTTLISALFIGFAFFANAALAAPDIVGGGSSSVGDGSPAALGCVNSGGVLVTVTEPESDSHVFCRFDRALIEEWTLFHGAHGSSLATDLFLNPVAPGPLHGNPSWTYCIDNGGTVKSAVNADDLSNTIDFCAFSDGSKIELWTLFDGPDSERNTGLSAALLAGPVDAETVDLNPTDARWLWNRLQAVGIEADAVVGAQTYRADAIACEQIVYPGMPTSCTIDAAGGPIDLDGAVAKQLFGVVDRAVGRIDTEGTVGAAHVRATTIVCTRVVVPGATARCSLIGP